MNDDEVLTEKQAAVFLALYGCRLFRVTASKESVPKSRCSHFVEKDGQCTYRSNLRVSNLRAAVRDAPGGWWLEGRERAENFVEVKP